MQTAFEKEYADEIVGKLTAVDRLIIHGHLTYFFQRAGFQRFLHQQGVLLKDFRPYVLNATAQVRAHALKMAADAQRPYMHLNYVLKGKDDLARKIAQRDGIKEGLICVLSTLEVGWSFDVKGNHQTHKLDIVRRPRKCLHWYFYFMDPEFGFIHLRLQSWFPFQIQMYLNGREWLARQLDGRGIGFRRYDNALVEVDDLERAQEIADRLGRRKWPRLLDALAHRINPLLPVLRRFCGGLGYYWVVDQCEIATDILWKTRESLSAVMPDLLDHAISTFSPDSVMRFLGRKLTGHFKGEAVSDDRKVPITLRGRPEGRRVKHRIAGNWIKFYDKWSALRIETVINKPSDFRILRAMTGPRGRKKLRWMRMAKGVANLWRYVQVGRQSNERYLGALAQARLKGKAVAELDRLCQSRLVQGKHYARFHPVSEADCALFRAVLAGEHAIHGFRNRHICNRLHAKPAASCEEARRRCARISRLIAKLRGHGLVAKVPKSRLYRLTERGQRLMSTAIHYRECGLPVRVAA